MPPDRVRAHRPDVAGDQAGDTTLISLGLLCDLCRARINAVLTNAGRHPGCGPYEPINETAYERLVVHLLDQLGATVVETTTTKEI